MWLPAFSEDRFESLFTRLPKRKTYSTLGNPPTLTVNKEPPKMRRLRLPLSRTRRLSELTIGVTCLLRVPSALGSCDNLAPVSGESATCDSSLPNPSLTGIAAAAGSTGVTVRIQPGAGISVSNSNAVFVRDSSTVTNLGTLQVSGDTFDGITAEGSPNGFGHNTLTNAGAIHTTGVGSEGTYNGSASVTMVNAVGGAITTSGANSAAMLDVSAAGGGKLTNNGTLATSGDDSYGMLAQTSGDALANTGSITTTGSRAYGLYANGGAPGNNTLTNHGSIDTYGVNAHGIVSVDASPGLVTNTGSIAAHGADALGAFFGQKVTLVNAAGARKRATRATPSMPTVAAALRMPERFRAATRGYRLSAVMRTS
ncbi:hypothetical protein AXG89_10460 [Burkholderia sp. PAMC 26561]|nr:hypothetical protein AXG89_10460 [Burkholderia sp. PAMC 26561]